MGAPALENERREMSEERELWGVGTPRALRGNPLLPWRLSAPDGEVIPVYPVFSSKEKAEEFAKDAFARGTGDNDIGSPALLDLIENIRKIEPDEIPAQHYVMSDREGFVKWSELLGDSE